ncbi:hypothetical protein QZH41_006233 [Actinostola sp. cb2023]|nr:hypothetical protein QZH41_006233 [Actinostola sp. cb2023]
MAVIDVKLVSGYSADEESLERLMNRVDLNLMKFEIEENKVVFYFDEIKKTCISFEIHQTAVVKKTKPASVTVYEYYDTAAPNHCPLCPEKVDLGVHNSLVCKMNNVMSIRTLKDGQKRLEFLATRQSLSSKTPKRKDDRPIVVSVPKGCRCAALDAGSDAFVLLKQKKISKKPKRLDLDENAMVLDRKTFSAKSLTTVFANCFANLLP